MAVSVLKNAKILVNGADLTGYTNTVTVGNRQDVLDVTCFGSSNRKRKTGLYDYSVSISGFWDSSGGIPTGAGKSTSRKPDPISYGSLTSSGLVSLVPDGSAPGNIAYFGQVYGSEFSIGGTVGDMMGY